MNWQLEGKTAKGKQAALTIVGGPDTEKGVRELAGVTHPGFTVSKATADRPDDVKADAKADEPAPSEARKSKPQQ